MYKQVILGIVISLSFNSCIVSKKKYDAALLENSKLSKELKSVKEDNSDLNTKVKLMVKEFETMKNDLHLSNAVKSDEMSDLLVKVTQLSDLNDKLKNELDETLNKYKSQKQTSLSVSNELDELKRDNQKLVRDTASIKYALKLSKERFSQLEKEMSIQKEKYNKISSSNQTISKELELNKQKLNSFEQQLISNKSKLEAISNAFIELRKEMLTAKSNNNAIDPNKNKNIDKIAKELGHY